MYHEMKHLSTSSARLEFENLKIYKILNNFGGKKDLIGKLHRIGVNNDSNGPARSDFKIMSTI